MKRRAVLAVLPTFGVAGCLNDLDAAMDSGGDGDPMRQSLGGDFDEIRFSGDGTAELYFAESHACNGFALQHEAQQDIEQGHMMLCGAPSFRGPIEISIVDRIRSYDERLPDGDLKVVGLDGNFSECNSPGGVNLYRETTSTANFTVPPSIWDTVYN